MSTERMLSSMKVTVITLFPGMFESYFEHSMMLKAQKSGHLELDVINLRDFGLGPRKQVDDTPYGGGDGMVLRPEPVVAAIEYAQSLSKKHKVKSTKTVLMSPQGATFAQAKARDLSELEHIVLVCGRYEGFDERIRAYVDEEISVGDYVLTGGELPAMTVIDATVRLIPGVLGGEASAEIESFSDGETLEYPQYTKPDEFRGEKVPDILKSGNHGEIAKWRQQQAEVKTSSLNRRTHGSS